MINLARSYSNLSLDQEAMTLEKQAVEGKQRISSKVRRSTLSSARKLARISAGGQSSQKKKKNEAPKNPPRKIYWYLLLLKCCGAMNIHRPQKRDFLWCSNIYKYRIRPWAKTILVRCLIEELLDIIPKLKDAWVRSLWSTWYDILGLNISLFDAVDPNTHSIETAYDAR